MTLGSPPALYTRRGVCKSCVSRCADVGPGGVCRGALFEVPRGLIRPLNSLADIAAADPDTYSAADVARIAAEAAPPAPRPVRAKQALLF